MAKSKVLAESLFIRQHVVTNDTTYQSEEMDLSAYVDVTEGELLRLKRVFWDICSDTGFVAIGTGHIGTTESLSMTMQLTANEETSIISAQDGSVMAKCYFYYGTDNTPEITFITKMPDLDPGNFANGILVASQNLHVGVDSNITLTGELRITAICEFEVVRVDLSDALAAAQSYLQN